MMQVTEHTLLCTCPNFAKVSVILLRAVGSKSSFSARTVRRGPEGSSDRWVASTSTPALHVLPGLSVNFSNSGPTLSVGMRAPTSRSAAQRDQGEAMRPDGDAESWAPPPNADFRMRLERIRAAKYSCR